MIITRLAGGLGNQMFQWAAAKSVADRNNTDVFCCIKYFDINGSDDPTKWASSVGPTPWAFELEKLKIDLNLVRGNTVGLPVIQDSWHYQPLPDNCCLDGFWQSEKYFTDNAKNIRKTLKMSDETRKKIYELYPFLKEETVSVHVRRGDYVRLQAYHPCQTLEYYNEALSVVKENSANILILSDDISWCKENFKYDNIYFAENQTNVIDLYAMSLCSHNVISNSTFGWWGAWLNKNENKKIVAPKRWVGPENGTPHGDIIPKKWLQI